MNTLRDFDKESTRSKVSTKFLFVTGGVMSGILLFSTSLQ